MVMIGLETAQCSCQHAGRIAMKASQDWVRVEGVPILVKGDLDHREVALCQGGAELVGVKRCKTVVTVDDGKSHSHFVAIDGRGVVLSTACGTTDWSLISLAPWTMDQPGQGWIRIAEG